MGVNQRFPTEAELAEEAKEENPGKENWYGKFDFFLSCLGYAVGLGNVWRFPYLCYKNGGGAFFIPYFTCLFLVGIPIFLVELTLGQFSSEGTLTCWQYCPIFQGIGVGMCVVAILLGTYYNVIIAWSFWYFFASFKTTLPWTHCDDEWASPFCSDRLKNITKGACSHTPGLFALPNGVCVNKTNNKDVVVGIYDEKLAKKNNIKAIMPANDYLNNVGFQITKSNGLDNVGAPRWDMSLCLLLAWIVVFLSLVKGIKTSGKVVYFTALFPYAVLIILFFRGVTLEGSAQGIAFYIYPNAAKLFDATVWKDAAVQIFFSLSVSLGGLLSLASYNKFHSDLVAHTISVSIGNCMTSVFAGFVIFSFLGAFAHSIGLPVEEVIDSGVALAFIVYPQAMTKFPGSTFWSVIFFLMLITLGLDSEFATMETIFTGGLDMFPKLRKHRTAFVGICCVLAFLLGLTMTTPGGPYVLTIFDEYSCGWNIMVIALLEAVSVSYFYGLKRLMKDIDVMLGGKTMGCINFKYLQLPFKICLGIISPLFLTMIIIFSVVQYEGTSYGSYKFPGWADALGLMMTLGCIISIIVTGIYKVCQQTGNIKEKFKKVCRPDPSWGPFLVRHRRLITYVDDFVVDPRGQGKVENTENPPNTGYGTSDEN